MEDGADDTSAENAEAARPQTRSRLWLKLLVGALLLPLFVTVGWDSYGIPSASMSPTFAKHEHVLASQLAYGIEIPFTSTRLFGSEPARGDVIVFRYPLDRSETFMKRVIGLPGDEVQIVGNDVLLRRAGESDFEPLARTRTDEPCSDENGRQELGGCDIFEETIDGRTYRVRYMRRLDAEPQPARTYVVPEDHLFVLGDNRHQSHDSTQWFHALPNGEEEAAPYVPMDDLLSRADRIWFPFDRFWTKVR